MSEEELYELALSDVHKYSLLNEIMAIRDKRYIDEKNDFTIMLFGNMSLASLNEYVELVKENQQLKEQLQQSEEVIEEIVRQIWYMQNHEPSNSNEYDFYCRKLIYIATQKDILNKYKKEESE